MSLSKDKIRNLYRKRAANYDLSASLYTLIGFREAGYRRQAVAELALKPGDTVVEIGCGTGLNMPSVLDYIGDSGKFIGVDLTDAMLSKARQRIARRGWRNVELVQSDAAAFDFPPGINAAYTTFALTLVPEYEEVIEKVAHALEPGGRLAVLDLKLPEAWPLWLAKIGVMLTKPFGVSLDLADRKPWVAMEKYFPRVRVQEIYGGFAYIAVGEK